MLFSLVNNVFAVTCADSVGYNQCMTLWNAKVDLQCNQQLNLTLGFTTDAQTANREGCFCVLGAERNTCYEACNAALWNIDPNLAANAKIQGQAETNAHCAAANAYKAPSLPQSSNTINNITTSKSNLTDYIKQVKNDQTIQGNLKDYTKTDINSGSNNLLNYSVFLIVISVVQVNN